MNRRRLLLFGVPAIAVALAVGVWLVWPPTPGITLENFRRLHARYETGMTEKDVEALFGKPANKSFRMTGWYFGQWNCDELEIELSFSEWDGRKIGGAWDGRLVGGHFYNRATDFGANVPYEPWRWEEVPEPLLDKFRRWLRL